MPVARLSGRLVGENDPNRGTRAKLLYRLFSAGWDIYNGNGDQQITLSNIQKKIIESDAFIFTPGATLEDMFQAASVFVGFQTNDPDLIKKTVVVLNKDASWDAFINLVGHLHELGTVGQQFSTFFRETQKVQQVMTLLKENYMPQQHVGHAEPDVKKQLIEAAKFDLTPVKRPPYSVCVFCSASIKKTPYLEDGFRLGALLAEEDWGCISGAGRTGIMGKVVGGSVSKKGWTAGSNVPHIIEMEGLPDGLSEFWPRGDIYTRMEVMIEESDAFVVLPGGLGTVQEVLALVILKQQGHDLMRDKPVIIVNRKDEDSGKPFWQPLLAMLEYHHAHDMFHVVNTVDEVIPALKRLR